MDLLLFGISLQLLQECIKAFQHWCQLACSTQEGTRPYLFMAEHDRTRVNESDSSNEAFIHLRYTRNLDEKVVPWEF